MAIPSESGTATATLDEIYAWFREFLGRDPDYQTEALPRVGLPAIRMYAQIRCSDEAINARASHGAEPDSWCLYHDPVTGQRLEVPIPPPPPPKPPAPPTPPGGISGDIFQQILGRILQTLSAIGQVRDEVTQAIGAKLQESLPAIATAVSKVQQQLAAYAAGLIPSTLSLVGAALGGVESLVSMVFSNMADIGDIADAVVETVSGQKVPIADFVMSLLVGDEWNLAGEVGGKIVSALAPDGDSFFDGLAKVLTFMPEAKVEEI